MKIIYDHDIFSSQKIGGITIYFKNIYDFLKLNENNIIISIPFLITFNIFLSETKKNNIFIKIINFFLPKKRFIYSKINDFYYLFKKFEKVDIYHSTLYSKRTFKGAKKIITIHDMIPEKYLWKYNPHTNKFIAAKNSDLILSVSKKTKDDIISLYKIDKNKIEVIPNCLNFDYWIEKKNSDIKIHYKYFLYVGDRKSSHKNFDFLLSSFSKLEDNNIKLICCGAEKFNEYEKKLIINLGIENRILNFSYLSTNNLNYLYQNALAYISVSLDEGFGIPALEAFASGTNLILNDIKIYREIFSNNDYFYKNNDKNSLIKLMNLIIDRKIQPNYNNEVKIMKKKFHLDNVMQMYINLYKKIITD